MTAFGGLVFLPRSSLDKIRERSSKIKGKNRKKMTEDTFFQINLEVTMSIRKENDAKSKQAVL